MTDDFGDFEVNTTGTFDKLTMKEIELIQLREENTALKAQLLTANAAMKLTTGDLAIISDLVLNLHKILGIEQAE